MELRFYFLDGAKDLPYIDASDCLALLKETYHGSVDFTMSTDGSVVTYSRANKLYDTDVPLTIDFDKDVMHYADYNLFSMRADQSTMLDLTSIMKNGSFYDIDREADPDYVLTSPDSFYDRTALTEYINGLY